MVSIAIAFWEFSQLVLRYSEALGFSFYCISFAFFFRSDAHANVSFIDNNASCYGVCCNSRAQTTVVQGGAKAGSDSDAWVVDSGATHHITPDANKVHHATDYSGSGKLIVGNGNGLPICKSGQSVLLSASRTLLIKQLLHVPSVTKNLLSVSKLAKDNKVFFEFHATSCKIRDEDTGAILLQGDQSGGLYRFASTIPVGKEVLPGNMKLGIVSGADKMCMGAPQQHTTPCMGGESHHAPEMVQGLPVEATTIPVTEEGVSLDNGDNTEHKSSQQTPQISSSDFPPMEDSMESVNSGRESAVPCLSDEHEELGDEHEEHSGPNECNEGTDQVVTAPMIPGRVLPLTAAEGEESRENIVNILEGSSCSC
ncbi:hypothetical protein GQ457_04G026950 [Hibiscus cannabinus]